MNKIPSIRSPRKRGEMPSQNLNEPVGKLGMLLLVKCPDQYLEYIIKCDAALGDESSKVFA